MASTSPARIKVGSRTNPLARTIVRRIALPPDRATSEPAIARSVDRLMTAYRRLMMRKVAHAAALAATALSMTACATLQGAAIGGGAGAAVAAASGKSVEKGAAVGGVAGGVIGTVAH
jgi:hypothetical protein